MLFDKLLAHPLTRGIDLDHPQLTSLRRRIITDKRFLREIYAEWYERIVAALPQGNGSVLELGSGAGFLKDYVRELICSEVFLGDGADVVLDAAQLPFSNDSLRAIVMTDVLHHIPSVRSFFSESTRCISRMAIESDSNL